MIFDPPIFRPALFRTSLNGRIVGGSGYHPTASARIDAIYAAGGTCPVGSANAKLLLSNFIRAEETAGRWAKIMRLYIPGFGNAAANAIDIVGGTSGTFPVSGGVTHATGYIQGNGTTGYFDTGFIPSSSMVAGSACIAVLVKSTQLRDAFRSLAGVQNTVGPKLFRIATTSTNLLSSGFTNTTPPAFSSALADATGILISNFTSGNNTISQRKTSGFSTLSTNSTANTQSPPGSSVHLLSQNGDGVASAFSNAQIGALVIANGIGSPSDFSANLKTLWEGLFNLTLP